MDVQSVNRVKVLYILFPALNDELINKCKTDGLIQSFEGTIDEQIQKLQEQNVAEKEENNLLQNKVL